MAEQLGGNDPIEAKWTKARQLIAASSFSEAEKLLAEVVAARPEFGLAWQEFGYTLYKRKAYPEALEAFQKRLNLEPDDAIANYSLAVALRSVGRHDEGRLYLDRAITIKPDYRDALTLRQQMATPSSSMPLSATKLSSASPQVSVGPDMLSKELQQGKVEPGQVLFDGKPMLRAALVPSLLLGIGLILFYFAFMLMTGAFR